MLETLPIPAWVVILTLSFSPAGYAASADFEALMPTTVPAGTPLAYRVTVHLGILPAMNLADILLGADSVADLSFSYHSDWQAAFTDVTPPVYDVGFYDESVFVGGNNLSQEIGTPLLLGTVTVDTTGMVPDTYSVGVNYSVDSISALGWDSMIDPLFGRGTFVIIPEPTTVAFLALAGAGCLCRRRLFGSKRRW